MPLVSEILAEALEANPTDENIWRATRRGSDSTKLAERLLTLYLEADLDPIPGKAPHHFRPAYLSDFTGNSETPYDREFRFVTRSLCYADSVAVEDELLGWAQAYEADPDRLRLEWALGFSDCNNALWTARRIARYQELEQHGLLYYVAPPRYRSTEEILGSLDWESVAPLADLVATRNGYTPEVAEKPNVILPHLAVWFRELHGLLEHVSLLKDNIDLYLPSWFAGPELLNWWYQTGGALEPELQSMLHHHQSLVQLLSLPTFSEQASLTLPFSEIVTIRQDDAFQLWRSDLADALKALGDNPDIFSSAEYRKMLEDRVTSLSERLRAQHALRPKLGQTIVTGISTATAASLLAQNVFVNAAINTAPVVALLFPSLARWLLSEPQREDTIAAAQSHYRLFMDGNTRGPSGMLVYDRPPSHFMVDGRGRPLYWDLWPK